MIEIKACAWCRDQFVSAVVKAEGFVSWGR